MPTPTTKEIREKAVEIYFQRNPHFASDVSLPEDNELKEEGIWTEAKNALMGTANLDSLIKEEQTKIDKEKENAEIEALREKHKELLEQIDLELKKENEAQETFKKLEKLTSSLSQEEKKQIEEEVAEQTSKDKLVEETKKENISSQKKTTVQKEEETVNPLMNEQPEAPEEPKEPQTEKKKSVPKAKKAQGSYISITEDEQTTDKSKNLLEKKNKMSKESTSKRKSIQRVPTETSTLQAANQNLIALFSEITETLRKGIDVGNTNMPQGLMSMMLLADLLHGGAYAAPINELPYYLSDKSKCKFWGGPDVTRFGVPEGLLGMMLDIFGTAMANQVHTEIIENSNVPHVFPKIISDQVYAKFMTMVTWLTTQSIFTAGVTNVATLVKTGGEAVKNVGQGIKAVEEGQAAQTKAVAEALESLLPLATAAAGA